ncbi:helix-turn-helix transcriptional regulator [Kineococcus sp. DHX-1]|uniref:AraC family transcriptional regulator n=1 Tax=Kineococcus sp. DHX-1 TaxID=3349638 RepID=UPI0036D2BC7E
MSDRAPRPSSEPVQRTSFASADEVEVTDFIRRMYADHRTRFDRVRRGARFSAHTHDTGALGADRVRTSIDYRGVSADGFADHVFFVVHGGTVRVSSRTADVTCGRGDASVYPLGLPVEFDMHGFDVTTVRLSSERVSRVAREMSGEPAVRFLGTTPVSPAMHRYWRSLVRLVGGALADPDSPLASPLLAEDLAGTVAVAALHTFPNTALTREHVPGPGATAPATVRRAVEHVEANAHLPLTLTDLAAAAGTSARALQAGFQRHLGTTPLDHVRRVRLDRAHRELVDADPTRGDTVAAVAARWGFGNPGRFAAAHREAYGESPAVTLRR